MKPSTGLFAVVMVVVLLEAHLTFAAASDGFVLPNTQFVTSAPFSGTLALDGDSHGITEDHPELDVGSGSFTIEAWVNVQGLAPAGGPWTGTFDSLGWVVYKSGAYNFGLGRYEQAWYLVNEDACGCGSEAIAVPNLSGWHHVALVHDAETGWTEWSADGRVWLRSATTPSPFGSSPNDLVIGRGIEGEMDELRISTTVRYWVGESGESFPLPTGPFICDEHTVALWHFDEPEGTTIFHDACGTDNALALIRKLYLPIIARTRGG